MPFLYFLREMGNPVFDWFFELITHLGEETIFLVIAIVFFWCVNKREGYYILLTGLIGTLINQAAKLACRVSRPWVIDPDFQPVGDSKIEATGYSFPSGHTQNIASTFGAIAAHNKKKKWVTVLSVSIIVLVAFSRMYLGVHTPLDVLTSLLVAFVLVFGLHPLFESDERLNKSLPYIVIASTVLSLGFLAFTILMGADTTLEAENYNSALKNACTLLGCTAGLILVYFIDTKFTNFKTEAPWYSQIMKAVLGFCGVLLIKEGTKIPLEFIFKDPYPARSVRYFLVVAFAGVVWPLTFKFFASLRIKRLDDLAEKIKSLFKRKTAENDN